MFYNYNLLNSQEISFSLSHFRFFTMQFFFLFIVKVLYFAQIYNAKYFIIILVTVPKLKIKRSYFGEIFNFMKRVVPCLLIIKISSLNYANYSLRRKDKVYVKDCNIKLFKTIITIKRQVYNGIIFSLV